MKFVIDQNVRGAVAYQGELEKMANYGQTILQVQSGLVKAQHHLIQLKVSSEQAEAKKARLEVLVANYEKNASGEAELAKEFFGALMDLKRPVYLALSLYQAAYEYWSLKPAEKRISLLDSPASLQASLAGLKEKFAETLQNFPTEPQPFEGKSIRVSDAGKLNELLQTGSLSVPVGLNNSAFSGLNRVRLESVRVFLHFKGGSPNRLIACNLTSAGAFADRMQTKEFAFQSKSLLRLFEYRTNAAGVPEILVDGRVADKLAFAYFEPTPFTQWTVSLINRSDIPAQAELESLELVFGGSAIPNI